MSLQLDVWGKTTFEHFRASDCEVLGYIVMLDDDRFVPFDLLHRQVADAEDLAAAEAHLEEIGLSLLAQDYELTRGGRTIRVHITELIPDAVVVSPVAGDLDAGAQGPDLTSRWSLPLPAPDLVPVER